MRAETEQVRCVKRGLRYDLVMMGKTIPGYGIRALNVYERWFQNSCTTVRLGLITYWPGAITFGCREISKGNQTAWLYIVTSVAETFMKVLDPRMHSVYR